MSQTQKLNVTVMLGGPSAEREVSLKSGASVVEALRSLGHSVAELDPVTPDWKLPAPTDVVFLALHGTYGEDGTVQRQLDALGVPYTGCDAESSRIAFDKVLTKQRLIAAGVPTARYIVFDSAHAAFPSEWQPPVVLKPVRQGSSVGLQMVDNVSDFPRALAESLRYDSEVLMEERVIGRETTVGILEDKALPIVEIRVKNGPFDYANKYTKGAADHFCPAAFDPAQTAGIQAAAIGAFRAVSGRDYGRIDVMVRQDGSPVVLEVNTLPGMTTLSILPEAAAAAGFPYAALCQRMLDLAMKRRTR